MDEIFQTGVRRESKKRKRAKFLWLRFVKYNENEEECYDILI